MIDLLQGDEDYLSDLSLALPAVYAVQVGLVAVLRDRGVVPGAVVGHSLGEIAASYVAGYLSLEDGSRVISALSHFLQQSAPIGCMLSVEQDLPAVESLLAAKAPSVQVAVQNGPRSTVVSGCRDDVHALRAYCQAQGIVSHLLQTDRAFHFHHMDWFLPHYGEMLRTLQPKQHGIPHYSSVTHGLLAETRDAAFWQKHVRQPANFASAFRQAVADGYRHFVEISPSALLLTPMRTMLEGGCIVACMRHGKPAGPTLARALDALHEAGTPVRFVGDIKLPQELQAKNLATPLPTESSSERRAMLETLLTTEVAKVLGIDVARLHASMPLREAGMDSAGALELRDHLAALFHLKLPPTLVWWFPTVAALTDHLLPLLLPQVASGTVAVDGGTTTAGEDFAAMTTEELIAVARRLL